MKKMLIVLATFVTFIACAMAADAAFDRGGTLIDRVLLVSVSIIAVMGVHLIPARAGRSPVAWAIWIGCLVAAIYGHITFFSHSSLRAGEARVAESAQMSSTDRQIEVIRESLARIQARPIAVVTALLASENNKRVRSALSTEISQGKRAETLRDELSRLEASRTTAIITESVDPVTGTISSLTGWSNKNVLVGVGMFYALLVELVGAWLWMQALKEQSEEQVRNTVPGVPESVPGVPDLGLNNASAGQVAEQHEEHARNNRNINKQGLTIAIPRVEEQKRNVSMLVPDVVPGVPDVVPNDELDSVVRAIQSGSCKATVRSIKEHLSCSTERAMELRNSPAVVAVVVNNKLLASA